MTRALGIDYGRARFGLALSDEEQVLASPLPPYSCRRTRKADLKFLVSLIKRRDVGRIVVGLPLHRDGSAGEMAQEAEAFAHELAGATNLPVDLIDERGTTLEANRILREGNVSAKKRKGLRDGIAAVQILQTYLDGKGNTHKPNSPAQERFG